MRFGARGRFHFPRPTRVVVPDCERTIAILGHSVFDRHDNQRHFFAGAGGIEAVLIVKVISNRAVGD